MERSTERILTTHTGSLPRPPELVELLRRREAGGPGDPAAFGAAVRAAVTGVVRRQVEAGLDVINDGEQGKPGDQQTACPVGTGFSPDPLDRQRGIHHDRAVPGTQWLSRSSRINSTDEGAPGGGV